MLRTAIRFWCLLLGLSGAPALAQGGERVVLFAAASLADVLAEVEAAFEAESGHDLVVSPAGSSALARQIQFGAPADLFISANPDWMDVLERDGRIVAESRVDLLGNTLVLVAPGAGSEGDTPMLTDLDIVARLGADGRLATALTEAVPAGIYGREALEAAGLWPDLRTRLAETDNVRAALALVALGEAPLGVVYATDARAEPRVHVAARIDPATHRPILYPLAILNGRDGAGVRAAHAFLQSDAAAAIFAAHGFRVPPPSPPPPGTNTGEAAP